MMNNSNSEIDKRINVSKIANNISILGENTQNCTAAGCNSGLTTVLVQHAHDIVSVIVVLGMRALLCGRCLR